MQIVTLVGSSTQRKDFEEQIERLVKEGLCPLGIGIYLGERKGDHNEENKLKEGLRLAHRKRIEIADIIGIIRKPGGGIGSDTLKEVLYAHELGKEIRFAEEIMGGEEDAGN